jgi:hypothetical protein
VFDKVLETQRNLDRNSFSLFINNLHGELENKRKNIDWPSEKNCKFCKISLRVMEKYLQARYWSDEIFSISRNFLKKNVNEIELNYVLILGILFTFTSIICFFYLVFQKKNTIFIPKKIAPKLVRE